MLALATEKSSSSVFFSSAKSEPLQDKRETIGKNEGEVEDVLYGCSSMRKLKCASETPSTHTCSCITVRVCVGAAELYIAAGEVPQAIKSIFHELQRCSRLLSLALKSRT